MYLHQGPRRRSKYETGIAVVRLFSFFLPQEYKNSPADSPECFPLFAELEGREAAVGLLMEHPAPGSLQ